MNRHLFPHSNNIGFAACILGLLLTLFAAGGAEARVRVVTTTEDIAAIAREVGGNFIEAESITRGMQDAHFIEAKPSYMLKVNRADLLIHQGLDLEIGWLPLLVTGARNPQVREGQPGSLDLSSAIVPIEVPTGEVGRHMGDVHPGGNPHYPLDPANGPLMAEAIAKRLGELDPENRAAYDANRQRFASRIAQKIAEWESRLAAFPDPVVVTYHTTWSYFLRRFGIESIGSVEPLPGVPPSPAHLGHLAETMKRRNVKIILQANYFEKRHSELLARQTGAQVLSLPVSVGGAPGAEDYFSLFDLLVDRLAKALSQP